MTGHISDTCKAHVELQEMSEFPEHFLVQYRAQFPILCPVTVQVACQAHFLNRQAGDISLTFPGAV